MTDFLEETHAQVGLVALRNNPDLTGKVHDGKVPETPNTPTPDPPYVAVYTSVGWPHEGVGNSMNGRAVTVRTTYTCHCVGESAAAARAVASQVRISLLNLRPVIEGRNCGLVQSDDPTPPPPTRDETTGKTVMDQILTFSYLSTGSST